MNPYLALEGGLLFAGPNTTNDLARTANEISTYLNDYGAVRAGLRAQYPIASRATLFVRYAVGYQWASFFLRELHTRYRPDRGFRLTLDAGVYNRGRVPCRRARDSAGNYTPSLTNGGLTRNTWSVGLVYAQ